MNFSDSKVGKKHQDWLVHQIFGILLGRKGFEEWWESIGAQNQKEVVDEIVDQLRYNL